MLLRLASAILDSYHFDTTASVLPARTPTEEKADKTEEVKAVATEVEEEDDDNEAPDEATSTKPSESMEIAEMEPSAPAEKAEEEQKVTASSPKEARDTASLEVCSHSAHRL